jgi:acyl-CoA thioesterase I
MQELLYAALGDSTGVGVGARDGRGYVARLHVRLRKARLLNACASGATSGDVLRRQLPRVLAEAPSFATVFIGINDLIRGSSVELYRQNLDGIATQLAARGVPTLFCTIPDLAFAPAAAFFLTSLRVPRASFEERTLAFNAAVLETARAHGHGAHDLFSISLADKTHFFSSDGFHPSDAGYEALAKELWPSVEALAASR